MQSPHPKIVYNEECIDLRDNPDSVMHTRLKKNEHKNPWCNELNSHRKVRNDRNEVVNTALRKLAKSYNSNANDSRVKTRVKEYSFNEPCSKRFSGYEDANSLKSKSELVAPVKKHNTKTISPSSPIIPSSGGKGDFPEKVVPFKNKFTMTKLKDKEEKSKQGKRLIRDKSLEKLIDDLITEKPSHLATDARKNPIWRDQRLMEKYSVLKVPWKRSYTLPVYTVQPSTVVKEEFHKRLKDYSDKKTYPYDDGSDIDSMFYRESRPAQQQQFGYTLQSQVLTLLNISAYICALLVLSLIIWFISDGNKMLHNLLLPKPPENPIKKYIKYVGGGIIYTLGSIIRFIGSIFTIPTQQVYHPNTEYQWPPLT